MSLTLIDLHEVARRWCPPRASWMRAMRWVDHWGPAHELGHTLLATPAERKRRHFGLCHLGDCDCPRERCHIVELAAMRISRHFVTTAGRDDLANQEYDDTDYITTIDSPENFRASWHLLRRKHLWPLPRTRAGLERLLLRKLRKPNARPIRLDVEVPELATPTYRPPQPPPTVGMSQLMTILSML